MGPLTDPDISIQLAVRNFGNKQLTLYLEPWGEEFQMPPKAELIFVGDGPVKGSGFWVDCDEGSIVVTAWTGSTVQVFTKGQEIGDTRRRTRVPDFDSP
jgi:hypothetical protein